MVAGIVLFAYGVETALHHPASPLDPVPASALAGGVSLYFIAHVALRLRIGGGLGRGRPVAALAAAALAPVAVAVDPLVTLSILALVCVALIAYEVMRHRDDRAAIRSRNWAVGS